MVTSLLCPAGFWVLAWLDGMGGQAEHVGQFAPWRPVPHDGLEREMRAVVIGTSFAIMSATAWAQQPATQNPPPPKMFTSSSEVGALIAKAKNERKSDQA